ncbi:MAG: histidine kinase [candidate division Zixibacteria bacterium]|nr:histidine kinase [candidate division Zixibacteria bacterium]
MATRNEIDLKKYESNLARFDSLMQHRIQNILIVSSLYDSYLLEEDGQLAQLVFSKYLEFNLSLAPHIRRVSTGREALDVMARHRFDLVIVFRCVTDISLQDLAEGVKKINTDVPVVLLAFHERELEMAARTCPSDAVDKTFFWNGDVNIILTIVKYFEDKKNVDQDTRLLGVRVIILIEDSVRFYSMYLPIIYAEIMRQTQALMADGINQADKLLRMRARPKILMADSFEEGWWLFEKYKKYLLGIISDVRYSRLGRIDNEAGLVLAKRAKEQVPDLPILLQSSDLKHKNKIENDGVQFLHKQSTTLLAGLRSFIMRNFGFGDFVFRLPDGTEVARASDFRAMEKALESAPDDTIVYHGSRNHFSNWLMARTEFDLAAQIRPRKVSEFETVEELRVYLIDTFRRFRHEQQRGAVTDFHRSIFDTEADFVRIGEGSLGGKGRGLAFISSLMSRYKVSDSFEGVNISVPASTIIGTSVFDRFIEMNNLHRYAVGNHTDMEIANAFVAAELPKDTKQDLKAYLNVVDYPIAVRSSSLLEDSHYQPFAGIFVTHMLPNCHSSKKVRLERLEEAIKYTYASIYFNNSQTYIEATGNRIEEEKMAVIMQKVVGTNRDGAFYPVFSGVARSYNFYPVGDMKPDEGIAYLALGLGKTIVDGGRCVHFSPANPHIMPQFSTARDYLNNSQKEFFAIDMNRPDIYPNFNGETGLIRLPIDKTDSDKVLTHIGSTYSHDNDRIYDGTARDGIKLVTFRPILKSEKFPVVDIIRFLLHLGSSAMNCPVEIEFAAEIPPDPAQKKEFSFLQIRPMSREMIYEDVSVDNVPDERVFCRCDQALSHGQISDIKDIIYVRPDIFDRANMPEMAREIGNFNRQLNKQKRPYLLIGPGRWGSADKWLGIPVVWREISSARIIVEAAYGDFVVTPSYGTHFFQNIIAMNTGYLTIGKPTKHNFIDWDWLISRPVAEESPYIRRITFDKPLEALIDGRHGKAVLMKPAE